MKRLACAALIFAAACDSGTSKSSHDMATSLDMHVVGADGGEDLGGGGDAGGDMMTGCGAEGAACSSSGLNGLCKSNVCSLCTDTTDDSACASAYSGGFICVNGNCQTGCHNSTQCPFQICDPGTATCRNCTQDGDCTDNTKPYCQTNGSCGANPVPCTTGSACNGGWCCAGLCQPGGMCCPGDNSPCNAGASETCSTDYQCVGPVCSSPRPANQVYVDSTATAGNRGVGSKQCPITSLDKALHLLPSPSPGPFLVCTKGTFDSRESKLWPRLIPQNFELDGTYCAPTPAPGTATTHTVLNVPGGYDGVAFIQPGAASFHGFDVIYPSASPQTTFGIFVENAAGAPVTIFDVNVNYFQYGLEVYNAGNAEITFDSHFNKNQIGVFISGTGANVVVDATAAGYGVTRTEFDGNSYYGIVVLEGSLAVYGQSFTGAGAGANAQNVRADFDGTGLWINGTGATVTADHFSASSNKGTGEAGLGVIMGSASSATFRHSNFSQNDTNGVKIVGTDGDGLLLIDFGSTGAHGFNVIESNTQAGVCIGFKNTGGALKAAGNKWKSANRAETNCDDGTPAGKVEKSANCLQKVDIAGASEGGAKGVLANVNNCDEECIDTSYTCH